MERQLCAEEFHRSDRPEVALIANHGYTGVDIKVGEAPDTGGQAKYVNDLALSLERLGYRVTLFTRGGFPHFESRAMRGAPEILSPHVRYVFVPGGGDTFLPLADIALALDEQLEWLDAFVRSEAAARAIRPSEVYELVNSHHWDGGLLGLRLVERWRNDCAARTFARLLTGTFSPESIAKLHADRHALELGDAPVLQLGRLLLGCDGSPATPLMQRVQAVATRWVAAGRRGRNCARMIDEHVRAALDAVRGTLPPALHPLVAAEALGVAVLTLVPDQAEALKAELARVDRHVWTPHELASSEEERTRGREPTEVRRLRLAERRSHERMLAERTRAFVATSTEVATYLCAALRVPVEQIFSFPPCVDRDRFRRPAPAELEAAWAYLGRASGIDPAVLQNRKIVFEASRMDPSKRKDLLIEAFARVVPHVEEALLFIGGGPLNDEHRRLEQLLARPSLAGRAFLLGYIPEKHMGPLFALAHVYCSPSESEGFGSSVLQAAAARTAVICSERTPFSVQYAPEDAVMIPGGDPDDYAEALRRLLLDDDERDWRAAGLAERARTLDWDSQTEAFLSALRCRGFAIAAGRPGDEVQKTGS